MALASSTWHAHVRIDTRSQFAEYNDVVTVIGTDDVETKQQIVEHVTGLIISAQPSMKRGEVTICNVYQKQ